MTTLSLISSPIVGALSFAILLWRELRHRRMHKAMCDSLKLFCDELMRERAGNDECVDLVVSQKAEIAALKGALDRAGREVSVTAGSEACP